MPHICVLTNSRSSGFYAHDPHGKAQSAATSTAVSQALDELGHKVTTIEVGPSLLGNLDAAGPDAVFNLATGYRTKRDQANIAAMLELSGIPFTGAGARGHIVGLHKHLTKAVMEMYGIPTPRFRLIDDPANATARALAGLSFPVIVKPSSEGSSVGISEESVAEDVGSILAMVKRVIATYGPPALVEEFISGREFTVGVIGYPEPRALPVEEIIFARGGTYTYEVKLRDAVTAVCPAAIPPESAVELQDIAIRTFHAVGCADVARVDIRVSSDGKPYVLEINTLPGLMPGYSEVPRMAEKSGMSYRTLVGEILGGALKRRAVS